MSFRWILAGALAVSLIGPTTTALAQNNPVMPEEKSFESYDGVKLHGLFYKSAKGGAGPVILMLHSYKANPDEAVWADTAQLLVSKGFNVFRFDFRGHGKSTDIVPSKFWSNPINKQYVTLSKGFTHSTDNSIKHEDFRPNYYAMLLQDLAAARAQLDLMNDTGEVNSSSIYQFGAGDACNLGLLFNASEWLRERQKPNIGIPPSIVTPKRPLFPNSDPAGLDYAGGIWLGPSRVPQGNTIDAKDLQAIITSPAVIQMRNETPMLFVHGEKDTAGKTMTTRLYNDILMAKKTIAPNGQKLLPLEQTFVRELPKTALTGVKLLGNNLGTEKMIEDFLAAVEKERKGKARKVREWDKPLYIDVQSFGLVR